MILKLAHQPNHSQQNRFLIQNMATQEPNKASESKSKMFHQMTDTKTECFNHDPSAHESNKHKTHCEYPDSGWIFFLSFQNHQSHSQIHQSFKSLVGDSSTQTARIKFTSQIYSAEKASHFSSKPTISAHRIISKKSKTTTLSLHCSLHHDSMPINQTPFSI